MEVLEQSREGNLAGGSWLGLPELTLAQVPGKPGATLTSLCFRKVISQHPAWPQGSLRGSQERGQRTESPRRAVVALALLLPVTPIPAPAGPGRWAEEVAASLVSSPSLPSHFQEIHLY
jgi:hypothetical protein